METADERHISKSGFPAQRSASVFQKNGETKTSESYFIDLGPMYTESETNDYSDGSNVGITGTYYTEGKHAVVEIGLYQESGYNNDYTDAYNKLVNSLIVDPSGYFANVNTGYLKTIEPETEKSSTVSAPANNTVADENNGTSEQSDIIASIDNEYPIDIISVKMVRKQGNQDNIHIKVRKNFDMSGNDQICVEYITINNDGENVCDYGKAWVSALDQGQTSWARSTDVVDQITYEDLNYIKIIQIKYYKDNQSYCIYSLPESIKVYKDDIVLEEK